jgi:hypothetical protein
MVRSWSMILKMMCLAAFLAIPATASAQATFNQYLSAGNKKYAAADYEGALKYYKAAVKLNGQSSVAHQGVGNCYYGLGQKENALVSYDKALALNPDNTKLAKFIQKIRGAGEGNNDLPALPTDDNDLSVGMNQTSEEDSKKYNKWNSGRNYTKNIMELYLGPVIYEGGSLGFGFGTGYFFPATKSLFVGVAQNMFVNSGDYYDPFYMETGSYTQFDFETLLLVKYVFEGEVIRPMIFGGGGLDSLMTMISTPSYSDFDFDFYPELTVGGGVSFPLGNDASLFAQSRLVLQFVPGGTYTIIPVEFGASFPVN